VSLPGRFPLLAGPTPLQRHPQLERALETGPLWIKRDDLTGFAVAGNKARALEFLLGDAIDRGADIFVAGGRPGSNFCPAAAAAARVAGLDCHLVMAQPDEAESQNVRLARAFEARIVVHPGDGAGLDDAIVAHTRALRVQGRRPYAVPRGGSTAIGAWGYAAATAELAQQCAALGLRPAAIVVSVGTGGTIAGLLAGRAITDADWTLEGVCVSAPASELRTRVATMAADCAALSGAAIAGSATLVDAPGAHGRLTPAQSALADVALREAGLLLDRTYTAKAFEHAVTVARRSSRATLFVHTGGIVSALQRIEDRP
jgi:D-cysteine desulfhydrase